jgi:hypothetical protein
MLFYIYHDGVKMKVRKGNKIDMVKRFGPDWPGARLVCDDAQAAQTTEIPPNWVVPLQ